MEDEIVHQSSSVLTDKRAVPRNSIELQKLLIDERIRCETHKTNYQTLKEEHCRLQDEHMKLQEELTGLHRDKQSFSNQQEKKDEIIEALQRRLDMKQQELEVTKTQVVDPQKLEAIKGEISQELEGPIKEYMISMDKEVEKYRTDYNKMRYQYTILKTDSEHLQQKAARELEEQKLRYQTEISALKYERDELNERLNEEEPDKCNKENDLLQLKKIRSHLEQRVNMLEDELEDERKCKEVRNREMMAMRQTQTQDIIKLESNVKSLEMEKKSMELQCERYKKEMSCTYDRVSCLSRDLQDTTKQSAFYKSELQEFEHRHKLLEANHKMEMLKVKGELEREKEAMCNIIKSLETELELAKATNVEHEDEMEKMEQEIQKRIQNEIRCEWEKNNLLTNEKSVLEQKLDDFERRFTDEKMRSNEKLMCLEEDLKNAQSQACGAKKELEKYKEKLRKEEMSNTQYKRQIAEGCTIRDKLQQNQVELLNINEAKKLACDELDNIKCKFNLMRNEMEQMNNKFEHERCEFKRMIEHNAEVSLEEKRSLQKKLDTTKTQLKKYDDTNKTLRNQHKKLKAACLKKVRSLNNSLELKIAENDRMEIELKAGKHGVSTEEHNRLKQQYRDIERKLRDFKRCISTSGEDHLHHNKHSTNTTGSCGDNMMLL